MGGDEAPYEKFLAIPIEGPYSFFRVSDIEEKGEEFDGMEWGTYEWNPTTGTFSATPIVVTSGLALVHPYDAFERFGKWTKSSLKPKVWLCC